MTSINLEDNIDEFAILSAIMASKAGHSFVKDCVDYYKSIIFLQANKIFDVKKK
jgi:hypothetical protein